jgi:hypothetical protein
VASPSLADDTADATVWARVAVASMTLGEKLSLVHGRLAAPWGGEPKPVGSLGSAAFVPGLPRLAIPPLQETDAELGVANPGEIRRSDTATAMPSNLSMASPSPQRSHATRARRSAPRLARVVARRREARGRSLLIDPDFDLDLHVETPLQTMTAIWMGPTTVSKELAAGRLTLTGDRTISRSMQQWLGLSPFAKEKNRRVA